MSLPGILAKLLAQQAELAAIVADHRVRDESRRLQLAEEIRQNAAEFRRFVARYQIVVKRRPCAPAERAAAKPHCGVCAKR